MYKPTKISGDTVAVPQIVFSRLASAGSDDARFRVALYILGSGGAEASQVAQALGLSRLQVDAALQYWEGAGVLENHTPPQAQPLPIAPKPKRLTTREVAKASSNDATLGLLVGELQRVYGCILSESDINIFVSLYVQDNFAADLILTAAAEAAKRGATSAKYAEKVLFGWRKNGINSCDDADSYLRLQAKREQREQQLAERMNLKWDPFTLADKKKIAIWFEEYGYEIDMIEQARMSAGDKHNDIRYIAGVLKNWHGKGYKTPRDLAQGNENHNLRSTRSAPTFKQDLLANITSYVPADEKSKGSNQS